MPTEKTLGDGNICYNRNDNPHRKYRENRVVDEMGYAQEIAKMKRGEFSPLYLVLGTEQHFIQEVKQTLLDYSMEEADQELNVGAYNMAEVTVGQALEDAESMPFFGERRLVIIENPVFFTGEKAKNNLEHDLDWLEGYLKQPSETTILAIFAPYDKLDNRKKISKLLQKQATTINVAPLPSQEARNYLNSHIKNEGYRMDRDTLQFFFERIEDNVTRGLQELPKLFLAAEDKTITKTMVTDLVSRNLEQNVFELVTNVLKKNVAKSLQIYRDLLLQKEEPIKINAILLGQFRLLLQVKLLSKMGYQQPDIAKRLRVHPYRVKLAAQEVHKLSEKQLTQAYTGLVDAEYRMKTGLGVKEIQFELFLLKYATN